MANQPSNPTTPSAQTLSAERIDFNLLYGALESQGFQLNDDERKRLEQITKEELERTQGLGGFSPDNIIYVVFKFLAMLFNPSQSIEGVSDIGTHLTQTADTTTEMDKLRQLKSATESIYNRLKQEGGTLAAIAESVTGTALGHRPADLPESLNRQLSTGINLPANAETNVASR